MPIDIQEVERSVDSLDNQIALITAQSTISSRSLIVTLVVCLYVGTVAAAGVYLLIRAFWCGENRFGDLMELLKVAVLPSVALVFGFYFGSQKS